MGKINRMFLILCILIMIFWIAGCGQTGETSANQNSASGTDTTGTQPTGSASVVEVQEVDSRLIRAIEEYLMYAKMEVYPVPTSMEIKINAIKAGKQPLLVEIISAEPYFVAGYCAAVHDHEEAYCRMEEYTWVLFEKKTDISESHEGQPFMVAFQIDETTHVTNILSEDSQVPRFGHFQEFKPQFQDGYNVKVPMELTVVFVYLNESEEEVIYHASEIFYHDQLAYPLVFLNDQYYIPVWLTTLRPNGQYDEADHTWDFGVYYDAIYDIMGTNSYTVTGESGRVDTYGLILLEEFADKVILQGGETE